MSGTRSTRAACATRGLKPSASLAAAGHRIRIGMFNSQKVEKISDS
jgi:hypothetical protein